MSDPYNISARVNSDPILNIMCVDDDDDVRLITTRALNIDPNITINCVASGREALDFLMACDRLPDCLLIDSRMPDMSGEMLMVAVRADCRLRTIPLILLTAGVLREDVDRYYTLGAAGVIVKPFKVATLAADIRQILSYVDVTRVPDPG